MPRDNRLYLDDILESIGRIKEYVQDMEESDFGEDLKTQDAVIRNLEIIGEAAGKLADSLKSKAEEIEWRKIIGLRNILIHEYFGVNLQRVWKAVKEDVADLADKLAKARKECTD